MRDGLVSVELAGPLPGAAGTPAIVLDVAHNPHAARVFAGALATMGFHPRTIAVFGMLADKDIDGVIAAMSRASTAGMWRRCRARAARAPPALRDALLRAGVAAGDVRAFDDVASAYRAARDGAGEADRIIVFGSFLTVAAILAARERERDRGMAERIADNADLAVDELKRRARRRLVGAIVLALAAAVILPLLLEKEPKPLGDDVSVQIPPVDEGRFINRLTGRESKSARSRRQVIAQERRPPKSTRPQRRRLLQSPRSRRHRRSRRTRPRRQPTA